MGLRLERFVTYRSDYKVLAAALCLTGAPFAVYLGYFDILAPAIPQGSVRANSGAFFAVPVFLLLSGQTLIATWLTHISMAVASPERKDALRAYLVASFQVLLFSGFYVLFPFYGPYTFVVYFMPGESFGRFAYVILVGWTLAIILATTALTKRAFNLDGDTRLGLARRLLLAATTLVIVLVTAS